MEKKNKNMKSVEPELIKNVNDDTDQVKKFAFILIGVAVVALLLYLFSVKVLIKDDSSTDKETTNTETIAYTSIDVGNVFNRPYDEYYVLAYDSDSLSASLYAALLNSVDKEKGKIYFLNLGSDINKSYVKEESNPKATKASELAIKEPTLIMISKGKISKYIENFEEIEKELK